MTARRGFGSARRGIPRLWTVVAGVSVAILCQALFGVAPAASPALAAGSLTVPSVGVGPITTPTVGVPPVGTLPLPTPPLPRSPLPPVPLPISPVPKLPVPAPPLSVPAEPTPVPAPAGGSPAGGASASAPWTTPPVPAPVGFSAPAGERSSTAALATGSPSSGSTQRQATAQRDRDEGRRLPRAQLVALVLRLQGCLVALTPRQRAALTLRTGIGLRRWYAPRQVASMLRVSPAQEEEIESAAVARLRYASQAGLCASGSQSLSMIASRAAREALTLIDAALGPAYAPTNSAQPGSSRSAKRSKRGRRAPSRGRRSRRHNTIASQAISRPGGLSIAPLGHGSAGWLIALGALALLIAAAAVVYTRWGPSLAAARLAGWRMPPRADRQLGLSKARYVRLMGLGGIGAGALSLLRRSNGRRSEPAPPARPAPVAAGNGLKAFADVDDVAAALQAARTLERMGDLDRAEAAYTRADNLGDATAAFWLGSTLASRGDDARAEAAYRRADERGHPAASSNLGVVLERRGALAEAEAAYRRASDRGDVNGTFNLGGLLAQRGDIAGAEGAYRRAEQAGDAAAGLKLGELLAFRGDRAGAESAFRRAEERGRFEISQLAHAALVALRDRN